MRLDQADSPWQWQIVRADFEPIRGSEQAGVRPALIISREAPNLLLPVLVVLPITSLKRGREVRIGEAAIPAGVGGLTMNSVAMCQQIRTISKERMLGSYGYVTDKSVKQDVREALRVHLDLLD